jgi:hypothetical protein
MWHIGLGSLLAFALGLPAVVHAQSDQADRIAVPVVMVGHSDPTLQAHAKQVEAAIDASTVVALPADLQIQGIVSGRPLQPQSDLQAQAAQARRQLGRGEVQDGKTLQALGKRMGVASVAVVRRVRHEPELVMFDVRNGAFFDRFVRMSNASVATIDSYVSRCAVASLQGLPPPPLAQTGIVDTDAHGNAASTRDEPSWFEDYWPVLACAVAIGALLTAFLVVENSSDQPETVIRFDVR